jgi:hypothetical protein
MDLDPVTFAGRLLHPLADKEVGGILNRIQWELMEVEKDSSFHEIEVAGTLQLTIAPASLGDRVSAHGRRNMVCS